MLGVLTLLVAVISAGSVSALYKRTVVHGNQLSLDLPERIHNLEFASADETEDYVIWENKHKSNAPSKGHVRSDSQGYTFTIKYVTFDDAGTYTLKNFFGVTISSYAVKVVTNKDIADRIAGETLTIRLGGLKKSDASLHFYGNYSSVSLVEDGVPVANSHPDYLNRIKVNSDSFQVLNVNVSDLGKYVLTDYKGRVASNITMILVDHHPFTPDLRYLYLLLLLIPFAICCCCCCICCRSTKSDTETNNPNAAAESIPFNSAVTDPVGPGDPGQGNIAGYPPQPPPAWNERPALPPYSGLYPGLEPQNPGYPLNPGPTAPPPQPPQWNAPPTQYNPSAPVHHQSALAGVSMDVLSSSDTDFVQFDINKGKSSGNSFL